MKSGFCVKKEFTQKRASFCWITLSFLKKRGFSKKLWLSVELNSKGLTFNCCILKNYEKREKLFINIVFYDFELWILAESVFLLEIFILNKNHSLLGNPLIFPKTKILISIWSQRTENQKLVFNPHSHQLWI